MAANGLETFKRLVLEQAMARRFPYLLPCFPPDISLSINLLVLPYKIPQQISTVRHFGYF
jgi:hypothetical protein